MACGPTDTTEGHRSEKLPTEGRPYNTEGHHNSEKLPNEGRPYNTESHHSEKLPTEGVFPSEKLLFRLTAEEGRGELGVAARCRRAYGCWGRFCRAGSRTLDADAAGGQGIGSLA